MDVDTFLVVLLNGASSGSILFLAAAGLSLIFGVMGILNLAHGALYMVGAYVGWTVAVQYEMNFWLAALAAGLAAGVTGLVIERGFLHRLYKQLSEQALLTFGFVYILANSASWIWGSVPKASGSLSFLSGTLNVGDWTYPLSRLGTILVGLALAVLLWWLQNKTRVGAIVRAGMEDKEMTAGLGVNIGRVSIAVFFFGAFIAGFAGVMGAQLMGIHFQLGIDILLLALAVIVVGGMGSVEGALFGGLLIGIIDAFGRALFPDLAMFMVYLTMIIMLLIRPTGLLGRKV